MTLPVGTSAAPAVVAKLSTLDRFLPVWIGVAMLAGLLLGRLVPGLETGLQAVQVDGISLPIAIGRLIPSTCTACSTVSRPGTHRPSNSPASMATPIHTGRNRSRVDSFATTAFAGAAGVFTGALMPALLARPRRAEQCRAGRC